MHPSVVACAASHTSWVQPDTMTTIIPRWEWRTFGTHFGGAVAKIEATGTTGTADSDETYLLVTAGDAPSAIVKIRFDLMDIKLLREVDADGLERWEPVLKVGFPMPAADVGRVIEALQLPAATLDREGYTLQQFLDEVAGPSGMVRPVEVHRLMPETISRIWRTASTTLPVPASPLVRIMAAPSEIRRNASPRSRQPQTKGTLNLCLLM